MQNKAKAVVRCTWSTKSDEEQRYHDTEWGAPIHDDKLLFEFLILEGAQAGLSWSTILRKRNGYRQAFDNFDAKKIAEYDETKIAELLQNPEIIRNRLKIRAAVTNAQAFLEIQQKYGSFDAFVWSFVDGNPIQNQRQDITELPAKSDLSDNISKALKKRGFTFVGSTICYAFMQAIGMVNDHTTDCFRYKELEL